MPRRALILIEGASNGPGYVRAAEHLDLHPIVLSADPSQYEYLSAEGIEAIQVDTDNLEALIRECFRIGAIWDIAGITTSYEAFCAIVGKLCLRFGLPGPNPVSIEQCCDKFTQRQRLANAGVPIPAYRLAANATDVESSAAEIGLPVVLKPATGSGSVGVRLCRNSDELAEHTTYLLSGEHIWRSSPRVLVEEFAQGPYYCAYTMENEVIGISAADSGPPPHFVFRECTLPAPLTDDEHERIVEVSLQSLRALGLGWGPTGIELRWTKRGPVIIEVNPRLAAAPDPQLIELACGVDLITEHIKLTIGHACDLRRKHSHAAAERFLIADRDGTLAWIDGDRRAAAVQGVAAVKFHVKPEAPIVMKGDYRDCMGYVVASSPSRAQTQAILERAADLITWSIKPFSILDDQGQSAAPRIRTKQTLSDGSD
ncbi:acetyl-CoA carboxylase biotin carboxylase subunit family protein [Mesorhizobium sp. M0138]|uniref:ATP-grasp domain-containing protein n=1 Tax=Mesorhizobium sp. M0138 TaxID=2956891 RepID=UPI003337F854